LVDLNHFISPTEFAKVNVVPVLTHTDAFAAVRFPGTAAVAIVNLTAFE
jgi:hypothetical protein